MIRCEGSQFFINGDVVVQPISDDMLESDCGRSGIEEGLSLAMSEGIQDKRRVRSREHAVHD